MIFWHCYSDSLLRRDKPEARDRLWSPESTERPHRLIYADFNHERRGEVGPRSDGSYRYRIAFRDRGGTGNYR